MRKFNLLLLVALLFWLAALLFLYQWSVSIVERSNRLKLRSHKVDAVQTLPRACNNTRFKISYGGRITQANSRQVSQAISARKLRDQATSVLYDVTKKFVHFENVCISPNTSIHPGRLYPFQARFNVYINGTAANSKKTPLLVPIFEGLAHLRNNFWIFEFINQSVPSDWKIRNEIAVLPALWRDRNHVYFVWYIFVSCRSKA